MSFSKDSERGAGGMPTDAEIEMLLADELAALTAGPVDALRRRRHIATAAASVRTSRRVERRPARLVPRRPIAAAVMGAAAALAVVLSLASARLLPDPVQSAVAHVAEGIGIQLPTPDDDREADAGPRSGGSRSITADPAAATTPAGGSSSPGSSTPPSTPDSAPGAQPTVPAIAAPAPAAPAPLAPSAPAPSTPPAPAPPEPVMPPLGGVPDPPAEPAPPPPTLPADPTEDLPQAEIPAAPAG